MDQIPGEALNLPIFIHKEPRQHNAHSPRGCILLHMNPNDSEKARSEASKIIAMIIAAIIGLAALITAALYDWSNKEPGERIEAGPVGLVTDTIA